MPRQDRMRIADRRQPALDFRRHRRRALGAHVDMHENLFGDRDIGSGAATL